MSEWKAVAIEMHDTFVGARNAGAINADRLEAVLDEFDRLLAAPSSEWVKTSDRLPTREDADEYDRLWYSDGTAVILLRWRDILPEDGYWMPKPRVQPPEPPTEARAALEEDKG